MNVDDLLSQIPMDQIAGQLGIDPAQAEQLARQAVPALVGGMEANAKDPGGAASLTKALEQHANDPLDEEALDISKIDTDDGAKIVKHVFGDNEEQVANQLGGLGGGGGSGMITKLLPLLAPLVMGFLAKQFANKGQAAGAAEGLAPGGEGGESGGGLGDLLGGLLGGGEGGGGGLSDMLGGLLGGGTKG